jgi:hypothetical protein
MLNSAFCMLGVAGSVDIAKSANIETLSAIPERGLIVAPMRDERLTGP